MKSCGREVTNDEQKNIYYLCNRSWEDGSDNLVVFRVCLTRTFFASWGLVFGFSFLVVRIWLESNSDTSESSFCLMRTSS